MLVHSIIIEEHNVCIYICKYTYNIPKLHRVSTEAIFTKAHGSAKPA